MKKLKEITVGKYINHFSMDVSKSRMLELLTDKSTDCYNRNIDLRYDYISKIRYRHNGVYFDNKGKEHFCEDLQDGWHLL